MAILSSRAFTVEETEIFSALILSSSVVRVPLMMTSSLPSSPLTTRSTPVRSTAPIVKLSFERKGIGSSGSAVTLSLLAPRLIVKLWEGLLKVISSLNVL